MPLCFHQHLFPEKGYAVKSVSWSFWFSLNVHWRPIEHGARVFQKRLRYRQIVAALIVVLAVGCSTQQSQIPQHTVSFSPTMQASPQLTTMSLSPQPTSTPPLLPVATLSPSSQPTATASSQLTATPPFLPPTAIPIYSPSLSSSINLLITASLSLPPSGVGSSEQWSLAWMPDGKGLVYGSQGGVWLASEPAYDAMLLIGITDSLITDLYWSPDGRRLALHGYQLFEESWGDYVWVVQSNGTGLRKLSGDPWFYPYMHKQISVWMDDHTIAIACWRLGLVQANVDNDQVAVLTDATENSVWGIRAVGGSYDWSPTQKHIVINNEGHLVLVDIERGKERWFSSLGEWSGEAFHGWSWDGQQFLYSKWSAEEAQFDLWLWDIAAETGKKLISHANQGALSPDGTRVVFLRQEDYLSQVPARIRQDVYPEQWPPALTAGMLEIDTGATVFYGPAGYRADEGPGFWEGGQPVWSPDGALVVYWGEDSDIWIASADGAWQQRLTWGMEIIQVLWSPDGGKLALRTFDRAWIIERPGKE